MALRNNLEQEKVNVDVKRNMVCTVTINIADTTTLSFDYRYLGDKYHQEFVDIQDKDKSFKAIEDLMNRYLAKVCGRLFSTGYLKNIDFTVRRISGDNIEIPFFITEKNIDDNETRKAFKAVEAETNHILEQSNKSSHKVFCR